MYRLLLSVKAIEFTAPPEKSVGVEPDLLIVKLECN